MRTNIAPAIGVLLGAVASASPALADEPARAAPDTRSGHVYVAPSAALSKPLGSAEKGASIGDALGWGTSFGGDLGFGVSRYVVAIANGSIQRYGGGECSACSGTGFAAGLGVQYHLAIGTPFDPWVGYGLGWRSTSIDVPGAAGTTKYSGIEFAKLTVGGDWFPSGFVGFGPWLGLDVGRYGSRSPGEIGAGAIHTTFSAGLRVVLDPIR